jgi:hypothetical protein
MTIKKDGILGNFDVDGFVREGQKFIDKCREAPVEELYMFDPIDWPYLAWPVTEGLSSVGVYVRVHGVEEYAEGGAYATYSVIPEYDGVWDAFAHENFRLSKPLETEMVKSAIIEVRNLETRPRHLPNEETAYSQRCTPKPASSVARTARRDISIPAGLQAVIHLFGGIVQDVVVFTDKSGAIAYAEGLIKAEGYDPHKDPNDDSYFSFDEQESYFTGKDEWVVTGANVNYG